ncbi:MAG TPA: GIY-YIG nuclease family protein [Gemmatimonadaceae bacterium]|nr:GIY-YIG nuclease family protein [Gemmatimonadaceae bacterium]
MSRIESRDPSPRIPSRARAFVYVAACRDEDILKLGFSRDPLARLRSFHPRYFAFFDLDRSFLIETDRVKDARAIERRLADLVAEHRAPSPLLVDRTAGGHTEWFRGAYDAIQTEAVRAVAELGHGYHASLRDWLSERLARQSDTIYEWSGQMLRAIEIHRGSDPHGALNLQHTLEAALDAYEHVGLPTEHLLPEDVLDWWRQHKAAR